MSTPLQRTSALVSTLKDAGQDFEFYPTTGEIIRALVRDIRLNKDFSHSRWNRCTRQEDSILDIGAGNGKVLTALFEAGEKDREVQFGTYYAIEKSPLLCGQMPDHIFVIGTDFHEQSLISKTAGVTFCNPPYSEFEAWAVKIIRESGSRLVYLVIPERWQHSIQIADALKFRGVKAQTVGSYDFENSEDRTARARVQLLRIDYSKSKMDAFECLFREEFAEFIKQFEGVAPDPDADDDEDDEDKPFHKRRRKPGSEKNSKFSALVVGESYPVALVNLYNEDMAKVRRNYGAAAQLDADLLGEFDINPAKIMGCLRERLTGLRSVYWNELFGRMGPITDRLTSSSRNALLETLRANVNVDFTVGNIHALIVWALKNANRFIDSQLIGTYEKMIDKANVKLYKSNQKTFYYDRWRYSSEVQNSTHFALDYRIVMHSCGGIRSESWRGNNGLDERASEFLGDLLTIANNLGFHSQDRGEIHGGDTWRAGMPKSFTFFDSYQEKYETLFDVRAFKNGNMHLRLNQQFMLALNVEHGRLKGWIKNPVEAADELNDPEAATFFQTNFQLAGGSPALLLCA